MTEWIANSIFFGAIVAVAFFVYQSVVLPGVRQALRFEVFKLRDELRNLVIEGYVEEDEDAFLLLHERLNFMVSNIARFDLAGAVALISNLDENRREQVRLSQQIIESAPEQIQAIYRHSVLVFIKALVFNSLALFVLLTVAAILAAVVKSGFKAAQALRTKATQDSATAFFNATQIAV